MAFDMMGMMGGNSNAGGGRSIVSQLVAANPKSTELNIRVEDIYPDPENKQVYSLEDIEELAASIQVSGLLHNIVVAPADENGKYMLISGERRWTAHKYLIEHGYPEFNTIRSIVSNEESENLRKLQWITANATARKLTDAELANQALITWELLNKLKEDGAIKGNVRDQLSKMLNISKTNLARYKKIENNMVPELREQFNADKLPISTAEKASELDASKQKELAERLNEGEHISLQEVKELTAPPAPPSASVVAENATTEVMKNQEVEFPAYVLHSMKQAAIQLNAQCKIIAGKNACHKCPLYNNGSCMIKEKSPNEWTF